VVDFVRRWADKTGLPKKRFVEWLGLSPSKFFDWQNRYGKVNEHNGWIPRDHWLEDWECEAIVDYWRAHPGEGYRRLTYMMLDEDVVAVSASTVYRVLSNVGAFDRWVSSQGSSKKGTGFDQPDGPHRHWHIDLSYIRVRETFYYLISVLDGFSRAIVAWDLRESMTTADVQIVLQKAREAYPGHKPRIISDNGSQFIAKDFKEYISLTGMTRVRTATAYPESNGKKERFYRTIKSECLRSTPLLNRDDAHSVVRRFIEHYNELRLHSAIGYITPADKLAGRAEEIFERRDRKLEEARARRARARQEERARKRAELAG
jgi:transposase InsO family protein